MSIWVSPPNGFFIGKGLLYLNLYEQIRMTLNGPEIVLDWT